MSCCGKEWKQKTKDQCLKHPSERYKFFCTKQNCLEILCPQCIKNHKEAHINFHQGQPQIYGLAQVQTFFQTKSSKQLQYEKNTEKSKDIDPCKILCHLVDDYFYGSVQNKSQNQQARTKTMKDPTAKKIIEIVEKQSEYRLTNNFKDKYFQFLDSLFKESEV